MVERKALAIALGHIGEAEFGGERNARPAPLTGLVRAPDIPGGKKRKHGAVYAVQGLRRNSPLL